jgi:hypothetical protein
MKDLMDKQKDKYEVLLGKYDSDVKKRFLVSFEYLGSGKHQITEIKSCSNN